MVGRQKMRKVTDRVDETSGKLDPKAGWGAVRRKLQVASNSTSSPSRAKVAIALPAGSQMTAEQFLNRLPKCVIRQGEVIDIRGPIRDTLQVRPALITQQPLQGTFIISPGSAYSLWPGGKETLRTVSFSVELVRILCPTPHVAAGLVATAEGVRVWAQGPGHLLDEPRCSLLIVPQAFQKLRVHHLLSLLFILPSQVSTQKSGCQATCLPTPVSFAVCCFVQFGPPLSSSLRPTTRA